jgi:nitroreductase
MDTYLAIASRREGRTYADRPIEPDAERRILDAGRLAGSAMNDQPWRFVAVSDRDQLRDLSETVYAKDNIAGAALAVAIVVPAGDGWQVFDAGRATQNMLLEAWDEGVAGSPNGVADAARAREILGLAEDDEIAIVLSLGYPPEPAHPESRSAEDWSASANRRPLDETVVRS